MISMLTVTGRESEIRSLAEQMHDRAAVLSSDYWDFKFYSKLKDCDEFLKCRPLVDLSCFDITIDGAIEYISAFRRDYELTSLLLIADSTISPTAYLKPGIRPDSLLLRPFTKEIMRQTLNDFLKSFVEQGRNSGAGKSYVIESKDGKINVPHQDIFYFEARDKKIYIRTLNAEYGFYETIEAINEELPDYFVRCHRSFIVNTSKIIRILISQNVIKLVDGLDVPLSRTYKPYFKNYGKM